MTLRYRDVRRFTEVLCRGLDPEDLVAQSMPDASPLKWHLAHTTWFFEVFVLEAFATNYRPHHPLYRHLFNSYYNAVGSRHERPLRGVLTRPNLAEVRAYRGAVDEAVLRLLETEAAGNEALLRTLELGLHHEQQHQELMLTDLKHLFSLNPLEPALREPLALEPPGEARGDADEARWITFPEGVYRVGHDAEAGSAFHFDNEGPRHRVYLAGFALAERPVTNAEYRAFIEDGGYDRSELWLDRGWATVQAEGWRHPLYWRERDGDYVEFTLAGVRAWAPDEPVGHVSFLEADAFARWAGARLATEFEWEVACRSCPIEGNFAEDGRFHPAAATGDDGAGGVGRVKQAFGDVWEWTASSYAPYPGYRAASGALGEYNGKFMCDQIVLRGGSCASSRSHLRATYRNFFYPKDRWQFSGIRLAKEAP